ncbi:unnamed protein product [Penicillium discolor]
MSGAPPSSPSPVGRREFVRRRVQALGPVRRHDHDVLDAGTPFAGEVDAGLDAEGHALSEHEVVAGGDVGLLMHRDADPVTRAVQERLAEPRLRENRAGGRVDLRRRDPGAHRVHGRLLRADEGGDAIGCHRIGSSDDVGPRAVGVVAARHRAADVDDHHVVLLDDPVGDLVVRVSAVGPGADDDELDGPMPLLHDRRGDVGGDLPLGAAGAQPSGHAAVHGIDRRAGSAQFGDLLVVLGHPALAEDGCRELEPGLQPFPDRDDVQRGKRIRHPDAGDGTCRRGDEGVRIVAVDPVGDGQSELSDGRAAHLGELHPRDDDRRRALRRQDEGGQPLDGVTLDTEEVLQVGAGADDDRVEASLLGAFLRACQTAGVDGGGEGKGAHRHHANASGPAASDPLRDQLIAWRMRPARNSRSFSVSAVTAYAVGQTVPSSRWEIGSNPKVP